MCLNIAVQRPNDVLGKGNHVGFEWQVIHNTIGYRCGYVRIPFGHPWHGKSYNDDDFEVDVLELLRPNEVKVLESEESIKP